MRRELGDVSVGDVIEALEDEIAEKQRATVGKLAMRIGATKRRVKKARRPE